MGARFVRRPPRVMSTGERTRGVSSWIPDSDLWIAEGRVVHYSTKLPSVDRQGRLWPRGTRCMALRAPNGDLGLIRFVGPHGDGDAMIVQWLHRDTGLAGVEPGVVDPMLMNLETATRAADEAVCKALAPYRETEDESDEGRTIERDVSKWVNVSGVPLFPTREEVEALRGVPLHASEAPEGDDDNPPPWDVPEVPFGASDDEELPGEPEGSRLLEPDAEDEDEPDSVDSPTQVPPVRERKSKSEPVEDEDEEDLEEEP